MAIGRDQRLWWEESPSDEAYGREINILFRKIVPNIPSTTMGVFGIYRYPAKFIPQVVAYILERYGDPGMWVLDPFAGSGTTGLVARLYRVHYELWDLNPLLEVIHRVAMLDPQSIRPEQIARQMMSSSWIWLPQWRNLDYWYSDEVLHLLGKLWGYFHSLEEGSLKWLIVVPLLKISQIFSYNDLQRQKLSRSPRAFRRVANLMKGDWRKRMQDILVEEIYKIMSKIREYRAMLGNAVDEVQAVLRVGRDTLALSQDPPGEWDLLVTSPPYLQAQEYIRCIKLDLFWLGYTEEQIRALARLELPYRDVSPITVCSETFHRIRSEIEESRLVRLFDRYFHGVLGALTALSTRIRYRMFIFVGPASIRGRSIPIHQIITEHFREHGWHHEMTLVDRIVARTMFRATVNPATGLSDHRVAAEYMVILSRRRM